MMEDKIDQESYSRWQAVESVMTPVDKASDHAKFVIRSYLYTRSRLNVPGRCYEDNDHGPISAGGNAHIDLIDFDNWLEAQHNDELLRETLDWMRDSSLELVAYWRGLRHRSSIKRRRDKILKKATTAQQTPEQIVEKIRSK